MIFWRTSVAAPAPQAPGPRGHRTVARAWRGLQAFFFALDGAGVARAWRGRGAGISCSPRLPGALAQGGCPPCLIGFWHEVQAK
eukprot:gene18608-biopygen17422